MTSTTTTTASDGSLTARQKLAVFHHHLPPREAIDSIDLNITNLRRIGVNSKNIKAAKLSVDQLRILGLQNAIELREFGFDSIDLVTKPSFLAECIGAFGAEAIKSAFLVEAGDAVAIAGSAAKMTLEVHADMLLSLCIGSPTAAVAVLQQLRPRGLALDGVSTATLLDAGLRAPVLHQQAYVRESIKRQCGATDADLDKLGF
jgi:hypothetical protein